MAALRLHYRSVPYTPAKRMEGLAAMWWTSLRLGGLVSLLVGWCHPAAVSMPPPGVLTATFETQNQTSTIEKMNSTWLATALRARKNCLAAAKDESTTSSEG